ncbi:MAG: S-layer homology domain-containing protein [Oscillibacter sp.]|nr:S-layer homology domain-containing protein [Oscillibacter sp.]
MAGKKTGKRLLTWVLVLVMALSLLPLNALATDGPETGGGSGMNFDKRADSNGDGTYTITMTAQATGTTTTTTKVEPMDIVLVLDQSGSMADDFNGNYTSNNEARRQYAMKAAVNSFIGEVAKKYSTNADHRMAIVTFSDDAETLVGWTPVGKDGEATLISKISGLTDTPSGATNVGAGMELAQTLMDKDAYTGDNTDRQKTVIVFTDGVPTKQRDFDTTVADAAIAAAKGMKNDDVTIYTVGIFNGANTKQLYGKNKTIIFGIDLGECSGEKNDYWQYRKGVFSGGDIEEADIAAGNRFLNYLSSNYDASSIGVSRSEFISIGAYYYRFDITDDPAKGSDQGYYKKASDASSLKNIFKVISDIVPAPGDPALDENTVITDKLSDYFTFATDIAAESVTVYAEYADGTVKQSEDATKAARDGVVVNGKTVTVTGYDFSAHHTTSSDPEKLVIEIKVKPSGDGCREEEIPTNADTAENHAAKVEVKSEDGTKTTPVTSHETAKVTGHKVFYNPDNDTGNIMGDGLYYPQGADVPVTNSEPTREGHKFIGWESDIEGDNKVYTSDGTNSSITMPAANVTLTAQWTVNKYTVTYTDGVDGEDVFEDVVHNNVEYGTAIPAYGTTDPERNGYTFNGWKWYSVSGSQVTEIAIGKPETMPANNLKAVAQWAPNTDTKYTVEYYYQNADGSYPATASKTDDRTGTTGETAKVTAEDKADKEKGKYTYDSTAANKVESGTIAADGSLKLKLYFKLSKIDYTIEYYYEGQSTPFDKTTANVTYGTEVSEVNDSSNLKPHYSRTSVDPKLPVQINKAGIVIKVTYAKDPVGDGTFDFNDVDHSDGKNTPAITKTVKGNVGRNFKETFKVAVEPKSENAIDTMSSARYTGEAEVIASKSLKDVPFLFKPEVMANAVVPYGELRFTEAGTYTYTVREEVPGKPSRMSYDTTEYTLEINVKFDANSNTYQVESWQFTPGNREYTTTLNIVNTYRTYHPSTPSKPTLNTGDHYAYVMGYPDGTVRPNGSITRAEVSAILFRLLSDKTRDEYFTTESSFTDVKAGAWYNNSIATLEKAGVIVDTAKGGAFRPNEAITRAELAAMLAQFSDAKPVKGVKFSDVSAEHWAYEAIAIAAKMGWIEGYPDGTFRPDATITRAEMMTLVNRALERVPSDEDHLLSKRVMLTFPDCKSGDWFYIAVQEATNSHTYERAATEKNGDEQWTALRANRDWTLLEK